MWTNDDSADQPSDGSGTFPVAVGPSSMQVPYQGAATQHALVPVTAPPPAPLMRAPSVTPDGAFDVPPTLAERVELCRFLADANLLPQALRKQPANVLLIMHKALALNMPLSVALEHLHVIDGKVGHSAELLRGLVHRSGHILRWIEISDKVATGELVLRHDPKKPRRESFTIADAQRMKLTAKDNWQKDPASMLVARCTTRLVSRHCPEIAVALGNLSAIDFDEPDTENTPAPDTNADSKTSTSDTPEQQAAALYAEACDLDKATGFKAIGQRAREAGLLDVRLTDPDMTLQQALLHRMNEISEAKRVNADTQDAAEPAPDTPRRGRSGA